MNAPLAISGNMLIEKMSNTEYHAHPNFSSSQLKEMLRSAAHFKANCLTPEVSEDDVAEDDVAEESKQNGDMLLGTLVHCLFLEPEAFGSDFVISEKFDRRTKIGKAEYAAFHEANADKTIVTQEMIDRANGMVNTLHSHPIYQLMQNNYGMAEASIFFKEPISDLQLRVRPDWHIPPCANFPNGLIIDLKTTEDARPDAFSRTCANFGYDLSAAMYQIGFQEHYKTEEKPPFYLLAVERKKPFNTLCYTAGDLFLAVGNARFRRATSKLSECLLINEWDGYTQENLEAFLPSYVTNQYLKDL
jgi:hypothetical protein